MRNTIIFDLGGVLIDWNPEYVFNTLIPDDDRRKFFLENICTHDWNIAQDAGRSIAEANDLLISQWPEWEFEIRSFYGRWVEMLGGPIEPTVVLLKNLCDNPQYRVLALTNWSAETFPIALGMYDFLHWFEGIVVSGTEKTRKPFTDIYQILLDRYNVDPNDAIFIDDNQSNVLAAETLGIAGIRFLTTDQLQGDLEAMGIRVGGNL
jgi:2-haloacid dehalogenase